MTTPSATDSRTSSAEEFHTKALRNLHVTAIILGVILALHVVGFSWYSWRDEQNETLNNLLNITHLEAKALDAYFADLEIDLREFAQDLGGEGQLVAPEKAFLLAQRFLKAHPELLNVTLILPDGQILLTGKSRPGSFLASVAREPSFVEFADAIGAGRNERHFGIGQPLVGVVTKSSVIVPVRYAQMGRDGKPNFIVSANLPPEYLGSYWIDAPVTRSAAIGLMRDNGYLLSRYPVPTDLTPEAIYGRPRSGALIKHLQHTGYPASGYVLGPSSLDGEGFLTVFRRLPNYPATLFIAKPLSDIRKAWWNRMAGSFLLIMFLLGGGYIAYRLALFRQRRWNLDHQRLEERLAARTEMQQKVLAREVNHRIKNGLQAVGGILERHMEALPISDFHSRGVFLKAVDQLESIAAVHGILSASLTQRCLITDVLDSACRLIEPRLEGDGGRRLRKVFEVEPETYVAESACTPVALIIIELLTNALKHSPSGEQEVVLLARGDKNGLLIVVKNPSRESFDHRYGNGLSLIDTLCSKKGFDIVWSASEGQITATLTLTPPAIA